MRSIAPLLVAFLISVAAAAVPVASVLTRDSCLDAAPPPDAPRLLVLANDLDARLLLCDAAGSEYVLERMPSAEAVTARIGDPEVMGVIFDAEALDAIDGAVPRSWLVTGGGRLLVGYDLTAGEVSARIDAPRLDPDSLSPEDRWERERRLGLGILSRVMAYTGPTGRCGGRGTFSYSGRSMLVSYLTEAVRGATHCSGFTTGR